MEDIVSDISRPGVRAAQAVAEYAAHYGAGQPMERIRELVAEGIADAIAHLHDVEITNAALGMLTDPDR